MIFTTTVIFNVSELFCKPALIESRFRVRRNNWRNPEDEVTCAFTLPGWVVAGRSCEPCGVAPLPPGC